MNTEKLLFFSSKQIHVPVKLKALMDLGYQGFKGDWVNVSLPPFSFACSAFFTLLLY